MTTRQTPENTVLALYPPRAPEATRPVVGADYGVPKHVYDLKPMGLTIAVDPPMPGTVAEGDVIRLVLNSTSTEATKTIGKGEENAVHTLYLPKGLLQTDRVNKLVYTITRGSNNVGTSTPELTLLYNAIRPGMEDRTPGDGAHSELELILPRDVIEDGIDADRAKLGVQVCFSYPYCRAHDVIWLNCNGQDVYHTVTVSEAPPAPSSEPTTICVMVEGAVFERAGDSPRFVFSYTVTDQLGNGPDTDSPFSGVVLVDVHLKETRLVAPDMAEDPDDPSDDPHTIDLKKLGGKELTVLVHAFAPQWQPNDKIRVTYTASKPGEPPVTHSVEQDVVRIPFTYKLMIPNAKVIAGSVVRTKYELLRGGPVFATSNTATADVIGDATIELEPPTLVAPAVNPVDPQAYPDGVTVRIRHLDARVGDTARLFEVEPPAGSPPFPLEEFDDSKQVDTVLSAAFLLARQGKVTELRWKLNHNGQPAGESPTLPLTIKEVSELIIDTSPLRLDGLNISIDGTGLPWERTGGNPVDTSAKRPASGGVPPYTYKSSNSTIVSVDGLGTVVSEGNGPATITVTDKVGQSKSYSVTVTNVVTFLMESVSPQEFHAWVKSVGGAVIEYYKMNDVYIRLLTVKFRATNSQHSFCRYDYPSPGRVYAIGYEPGVFANRAFYDSGDFKNDCICQIIRQAAE